MATAAGRNYRTIVVELAAAESGARRLEDGDVELTFTMSADLFRAWLELVEGLAGGASALLH